MREFTINGSQFEAIAGAILSGDHLLKFTARGYSMYPFLKDGDVIEVQPNHTGTIKVGDIILCKHDPNLLVVHRVVRVKDEGGNRQFITQGDALCQPDGSVTPKQVLGQVVAVERSKRRVSLDTWNGRIFGKLWVKFTPLIRRIRALLLRSRS